MKFRVPMKTPDALEYAVMDACAMLDHITEAKASLQQIKVETTLQLCERWFKHGELLTVEVDTEAQTCVVVPVE